MAGGTGWREWIDARTGMLSFLDRHGRSFRVPPDAGTRPFGGLLLFAFALQIATGLVLLVHFVADSGGAFESVQRIMREVPSGWLVRLLHAHGANWMVALLFLHLFWTALRGAYKAPREAVWWSGCVLFLLVLAAALSGYILPWSQTSYWATTVVTASFQYVPFVGEDLVAWARGGELVGDATFRRAFAAHVSLIPLLLLVMVSLHLAWVRRAGLAGGARREGAPVPASVPFWPRAGLRYATAISLFATFLVASVLFVPDLFFPAEHGLPADPFETPEQVKPEWYFLWAYQLPRIMPETLALALQGLALATLFALPLLDRSAARHPLERPLFAGAIVLGFAALGVLSVLGWLA